MTRRSRGLCALASVLASLAAAAPAFAAPPANDQFAAAELLTGDTATATGTTLEATKETGEPNHAGYTGGRSIWYRWVAPTSGVVTVDPTGSSYTPTVGVYTGLTVDGLTTVASNEGRVRFNAVAGRVYHVALDRWSSSSAITTTSLSLRLSQPPANDAFASAQVLTGTSADATGDTTVATKEAGEPAHASYYGKGSIWFSWTAPQTGPVTLDTAGSSFGTALAAYTGDSVSGAIRVASAAGYTGTGARLVFRAVEGTTYRIAVDGRYEEDRGQVKLALRWHEPPANDMFASATDLGGQLAASAAGTTAGATPELGEPSHYSYESARDTVWYTWTAPQRGSATINAQGTTGWRALAAYTGDTVSGLTRVANQAQYQAPGPQQIRIRVEAGTTYRIAVDGRGSNSDFLLSVSLIGSPANDDFADAQLLAGLEAQFVGTNVGATQEPGEPVHDDNYYDPSVWFTWTAPVTGGVTLDTVGSTLDTVAAVYTGDSVSTLTRIASTRTGGVLRAKRRFRAAAGTTYRIAVDGRNAHQGTYTLTLDTEPTPLNDHFLAAQPLVGSDTTVSGDNIGATGEPGEPTSGGTAGASVWYSWTAPSSGRLVTSFPSSDFGASLSVYTGTSVDALTRVTKAYEYDSYGYPVRAGTTYRIAVHGGLAPQRGQFTLRLLHLSAPANDDFDAAAVLEGASPTVTARNDYATKEPGEPTHGTTGGGSVWYRWTAPATGRVALSTGGSHYDAVAGVYTGTQVDALTRLGVSSDYRRRALVDVTEGTTYRIAVDGRYDSRVQFTLSLTPAVRPPNDHFADAAPLQGTPPRATGTNLDANREAGEPAHGVSSSSGSLWHTWTAPASGTYALSLAGSGYDAQAAVYTGDSLTALTRLASVRDGRRALFPATEGVVYRIAVDSSYEPSASYVLDVTEATPPENDLFANATVLDGAAVSMSGTTLNATREAGEPAHAGYSSGASRWYRWTAPTTGRMAMTRGTTSSDAVAVVYSGDALTSLTQLASTTSSGRALFDVQAGTTYRIAVAAKWSDVTPSYALRIDPSVPPANDRFADATTLIGPDATANGNTVDAAREPGEPAHAGSSSGGSVWLSWTAPTTGNASLDRTGTSSAAVLGVYTGSSVDGLTRIASSYDYPSTNRVTFPTTAGTTYRIAVASYYAGESVSYNVRVRAIVPPSNDAFTSASPLVGTSQVAEGSTVDASRETGEPAHAGYGTASIWWRWTAPSSGQVTVTTSGSSFDTVLAAYTGSAVNALTTIASNDQWNGNQSRVSFRATAGTVYSFAVDGYSTYRGAVRLTLDHLADPPPPPPAPLAQPEPDPPAEEEQPADPPAQEEQPADPPAEQEQPADPPAEEEQPADPPAEEEQPADPPAEEEQPADPPAEEEQPADPPAAEEEQEQAPVVENEQPADPPAEEQAAQTATPAPVAQSAPAPKVAAAAPSGAAPAPPSPATSGASAQSMSFAPVFRRQSLQSVLRKGVTGSVICSSACTLDVDVLLPTAKAARSGARAKASSLLRTRVTGQANTAKSFTLRLSAAAKRKLRASGATRLTVRITPRGSSSVTTQSVRVR